MTNKPCVTILDHDNAAVRFEIDGNTALLLVINGLVSCAKPLSCTKTKLIAGLTTFTFDDFTICHQKGGDCYVE